MKTNLFSLPSTIYYGENALFALKKESSLLGERVLLITDETMLELGHAKTLMEILDDINISYEVYHGVNTEPTQEHVEEGVTLYREVHANAIIALGGGSPIDAAKAIGTMVHNPGTIEDYRGLDRIKEPLPPLVAIPTTAGTGSEVTRFTIITQTRDQVKMLIGSPYLIPHLSLIDPLLTLSVPPHLTATTAMDALTHAIEAYTSIKNQPFSDMFALSSIGRIANYLPRCWANGRDLEARSMVMLAALEGGIAFSNASVTLVHGMSRPLGAYFHLPHGLSNAVLLAPCMEYALMGSPHRFAQVAQELGVPREGRRDLEVAREGVEAVRSLCRDIGIPTLSGLGMDRDKYRELIERMASDALESGSPVNTARQVSKKDIMDIYKRVF